MHAVGIQHLSARTCCCCKITTDEISKASFFPVRYILCAYMSALAPPSLNLATAPDLICLQNTHVCDAVAKTGFQSHESRGSSVLQKDNFLN